ncbi:hypothetical protein DL96DRAFT_1817429 [Flagelloscypha sp. PMI_526]|nr:hypothetical protein DL96DRAFT_1817429 [Flagelloscypha sp. PMI_526]
MAKALPSRSSPRGLRLLSFDGGGLRALSQAKILQETLDRIAYDNVAGSDTPRSEPRVADYFDLICGSGFGGLLAIMAGVLGMTGRELVDEFAALAQAVFSDDLNMEQMTARLEAEIKRIVRKYSSREQGEDRRMISGASPCKVFVCAASPDNMSSPRILRNYEVRANASPDCKVWEAARATTALVGIFSLITIKTVHVSERYVGGEVRWNNPTHELTVEIANLFPSRDVACIVSIGSGHPRVLCLSKDQHDLFRRISEDCEQVANELFRRFAKIPDLYWRLSVEQGMQDIYSADVQELATILASTHSYLQASRPSNDIDALIEVLKTAKSRTSVTAAAGQLSTATEAIYLRDCPPPTPFFTGQTKHLTKLRVYFADTMYRFHIAVLSGLGGSGKTQCGLMFIHQSLEKNRFTEVFFLDASDRVTLESGFKSVAEAKHVGKSFEDGIRYLEGRLDEWLLFLDNADDPELDLGQYIRRKHGNILITTRNPHVGELAPDCHCLVDRFDQADAKELLLRGVRVPELVDGDAHATKIVEELGCLALAVDHTRAFLAKGTCALPDYLQLYKENREELLRDRPARKQSTDDYRYTVFTTWNISFNRLSENARTFIRIICFMHHEGIPLFIFNQAWESLSKLETDEREASVPRTLSDFLSSFTSGNSVWHQYRFLQVIEEAQSFSLIEWDSHKRTVSFHPLVQQWARNCFRDVDCSLQATQTILSLVAPLGKSAVDYSTRKSLFLHFRDSLEFGSQLHYIFLRHAGETLYDGGLYAEALPLFEQEVEAQRRIFGSEHRETLRSMRDLAETYSELSRHAEALELQEQVLEDTRRILGTEHPDTLQCMHNLAATYYNLSRHADALELEEQVLKDSRRILGSEHPDTLWCMRNIAITYFKLSRHADALELEERVLEDSRRILGCEHPDTLRSMRNLATTYSNLSRHADALQLQEQVAKDSSRILGTEHPDTLRSVCNLAMTYSNLSRHADALELREQVLKDSSRILGTEHPDTLRSVLNLATTYSNLSRHADALELQEQVLKDSSRILGTEHPDTLRSTRNLAVTYSNLSRYADALELEEQVVRDSRRILGSEHPDTLRSMRNLAVTYSNLSRHADALDLEEQLLKDSRRILGPEHPDTLRSMRNLAVTYSTLGRHVAALIAVCKIVGGW